MLRRALILTAWQYSVARTSSISQSSESIVGGGLRLAKISPPCIGWLISSRTLLVLLGHKVLMVGALAISCRVLPSLDGSQIILNVWGVLGFPTYLFLYSSPLSPEMASFVMLWAPVD